MGLHGVERPVSLHRGARPPRRVLCAPLPEPAQETLLPPDTSHHVLRVLRVPRGALLTLFDGHGRETAARLIGMRDGRALLLGLDPPEPDTLLTLPEPTRQETPNSATILLIALVKGQAFEHLLRMATELGVQEIRPLVSERSCPRGEPLDRWNRVLQSAATQCGRPGLPLLLKTEPLATRLQEPLPEQRLLLHPGAPLGNTSPGDRALLVGPEGGLSDAEVRLCLEHGFRKVGLGQWILRADTAVAAALGRYAIGHDDQG